MMKTRTLDLQVSKIYKPLFTKKPRYFICMGGRSSGRSYAASQYAILHLLSDTYFRCAIMRLVLGDIRNSIFQEIKDRVEENELENMIEIKDTILSFQYNRNLIKSIGFRKSSGDQKSKLKSLANYNCVIIEEADETNEDDFMQLDDSLRTLQGDIVIILLLNPPPKGHWIVKRFFNLLPSGIEGFYKAELKKDIDDAVFIHGTYRDNLKNINQKTIDNFLRYKTKNPEHYYNMIEGLISEGNVGRIFKDWKIITDEEFDELPYESYYGLDFGFSNDPAALVEIKDHNENIYLKELLYEKGLTNVGDKGNSLDERFTELGLDKDIAEIYADGAEPKSIKELEDAGWNIQAAPKGKDSVKHGIDTLLSKNVHYTQSSDNIALETENYLWKINKTTKEPTNDPIDAFNHLMDGTRYGYIGKTNEEFIGFV